MLKQSKFSIDSVWKVLLTLILLFFAIFQARSILIPFVFSVFIAMILNPLVAFFERKKINRVFSIVMTIITVVILLGAALYYIGTQAKNLFMDLPDLVDRFKLFIETNAQTLQNQYDLNSKDQVEMLKQATDGVLSTGSAIFSDAISATSNFITFITLVPIYIFFILLYKDNLKKFLIKMGERQGGNNLLEVSREIKDMVRNYISGLLLVVTIIACLNSVGLLLLGIKYAIFMGVLSAVLTVIPYIGIIIGGALPFIVALITKDSIWYSVGVIGIVAIVQFLEGNFITPKIIGSKVNVNPLAAIIALLIGGKVWGIVGMILAIPLIGVFKIILSAYEETKPYAILLQESTDEED